MSNTIKDVVQSLVDDRLVDIERSKGPVLLFDVDAPGRIVLCLLPVGSGNYYWAFPSKTIAAVRERAEQLEAARAADAALVSTLEARLAELQDGRQDAVREDVGCAMSALP